MHDFIELIKEGFRLAANLGKLAYDAAKSAVLAYFRQVKKWTIRFFIASVAPLIVIVPCLVFRAPFGGLYGAYVVYVVLLLAAELVLITPMFLVWRRVKSLFPTLAGDLTEWFDFIKSVAFNGLSLGIFVTLFPIWRAPSAFPLLLLVVACWLTLPACFFSRFCKRIYPTVRGIQLLLLFGLLVLQMAFPRQVEQIGWATGRKIGGALMVEQREITSEWNRLKWFNNAGEPLVWYSGSDAAGYRLWAAPGFDPDTGNELQFVRAEKTRAQIIANLSAQENKLREREALAQDERTRKGAEQREATTKKAAEQTEMARKEAEQRRQEQEHLEREREAAAKKAADQAVAEERAKFLARYLMVEQLRKPGQKALAVVAVTETGKLNSLLGRAVAESLKSDSVAVSSAVFTQEFVSDGLFSRAFAESRDVFGKLELTNVVDALLFARQTVQYSTNASLENLITANMRLEVMGMSVAARAQNQAHAMSASGVGFKPEDARSQAEDRLIKQIKNDEAKTLINGLPLGREQ